MKKRIGSEHMDHLNNGPLKIKRRGEDGYRVITVRIQEDTLNAQKG